MAAIQSPKVQFQTVTRIIDQSDPNNSYIGIAKKGSLTSSAVWQIQRLQTVGGVLTIQFANASDQFNSIWDNRVSLSYS